MVIGRNVWPRPSVASEEVLIPAAGAEVQEALVAGPSEQAHQLVVERGYAIRWQVQDRGGTVDTADDSSRFTEIAPTCGSVEAGR